MSLTIPRRPPRISIVGAGAVAQQYHLPALRYLGAELSILADRDPALVEQVDRRWRPGRACGDPVSITPANTDLCIVATPPASHAAVALDLLERKVALLIEKPVVLTLSELDALTEVSARHSTPVYGANVRRFFPNLVQLRALVDSGLLGPLRSVTVAEGGLFNWPAASGYLNEAADEGVITDTGAHCLDLLLYLAPLEPAHLRLGACRVDRYPQTNTLDLEFLSAATGVEYRLKISRSMPLSNRVLITTDRAEIGTASTFSLEDLSVAVKGGGWQPWRVGRRVPRHNVRFAFVRQLDHVLRNLGTDSGRNSPIGLDRLRGYVWLFEIVRQHRRREQNIEFGPDAAHSVREVA